MAFTSPQVATLETAPSKTAEKKQKKIRVNWSIYTFILPAALFLGIFSIYPILMTFVLSFEQVDLGGIISGDTPFAGLQNYQQVLSDPVFQRGVGISLIFTIASVTFQYLFGFLLALLFNQRFPLHKLFRGLVMIGWVLPIVVNSTIFKWMLQQDTGIINYALLSLHITQQPIPWLTDPKVALLSPIIANIWLGIPFYMALLLAGLQSISPQLYEAARVDGANGLQRLRYITVPLMRSPSLIVLVLGIIYTLNVFDLIYILTNGGPANATNVLPIYAYQQAFSYFNLGNGAAVTVLMFVFLLVVSTGYLFLIRREGSSAA
ncbi:MAG: sugar ABC transporter permease [Ktedonobacteraceae bacterium]|nr:sugar ABC transporter permease [Ktedonobacteraceae bacterium]